MTGVADRQFDKVVSGTRTDYDCSPDLFGMGAFRGVRVHAPSRALFGRRSPGDRAACRVMLCGASRLDARYLDDGGYILLVAVDATTHEAFAHPMVDLADVEPPPPGAPRPPPGAGPKVSIRYFNADLVSMLSLPERETDYLAYAVLGQYVSNVVRIEVRAESPRGGVR